MFSLVNWNWPIKHCWAQQICRGTQPLSPTFEADASIFGFSNHEGNPCTALNHPSSRSFGNQEGEGERERARQFSPSSPQSETVFTSQRGYWSFRRRQPASSACRAYGACGQLIAHAQSTMSGWNGFLQIPHTYFALRLMYPYRFLCVTPRADVCPAGSFLV